MHRPGECRRGGHQGQHRDPGRDGARHACCAPTSAAWARRPSPFDIVFLDPPYGSGFAAPALANVAAGGWLAPGALVVAEVATRDRFETPPGWALEDDRRYGAARLLFLRPELDADDGLVS